MCRWCPLPCSMQRTSPQCGTDSGNATLRQSEQTLSAESTPTEPQRLSVCLSQRCVGGAAGTPVDADGPPAHAAADGARGGPHSDRDARIPVRSHGRAHSCATACMMHCGSHAHRHAQAHARLPTTMRTHWSPRPLGTAQRWRWRRSCERRAQASQIACCRGRDGGDAPDAPEEGPKQPVRSSTATLFGTQGPMRLRRNVDCANAGRTLANVAKPLQTMC